MAAPRKLTPLQKAGQNLNQAARKGKGLSSSVESAVQKLKGKK